MQNSIGKYEYIGENGIRRLDIEIATTLPWTNIPSPPHYTIRSIIL